MKLFFIAFFILLACISLYAEPPLKLELMAAKNQVIQCEPVGIFLSWQNVSDKDLKIGFELSPDRSSNVTLLVDGRPTLKLPVPPYELVNYTRFDKDWLAPGERKSGGVSVLDLDLQIGSSYVIKAIADFASNPEGFYRGTVESNSLSMSIQLPKGTDFAALLDAEDRVERQGIDEKQKRIAVCAELQSDRILVSFPDSIYAAWQLAISYIDRVENKDPATLARLINSDLFPEPRDIPFGTSGQRFTARGKNLAQWEYDSASRIVKMYPDFPLADSLRLSMAANALVLGKANEAFNLLGEVADKKNLDLANWAKRFDHQIRIGTLEK